VFTRGLPGSGKTTYAKEWVKDATPSDSRARVNRDDLRQMLHDGWGKATEQQVIIARDALIAALLKRGVSVINDDTNLPQRTARDLRRLAERTGVEWEVVDFTNVPLDTCIKQDLYREGVVGKEVIYDFYNRYLKGKSYPLPLPEENDSTYTPYIYTPDESLPKAVIFDIDGTVCLRGDRGWYEEDKIHLDRPNRAVVDAAVNYAQLGYKIIFCSGRTMGCYDATFRWLCENVLEDHDGLVMRAEGDNRQDSVVKSELFEKHIAPRYNVTAVFDDRNQVVEMWRQKGLTCFQVAEGDF
jgi:predicted kinase